MLVSAFWPTPRPGESPTMESFGYNMHRSLARGCNGFDVLTKVTL